MPDPIEFPQHAVSAARPADVARRPLWPFDVHRRMVGWLLPKRVAGTDEERDCLSEPRLRMALTGMAVLLEGLISAEDPLEAWSRYQTLWDEPAPAHAADGASAPRVDFPGADRRAFLLRRALGNLAPAGLDFSALERVKVRLASLRAHVPESFDPDAQARGDIDAALLQTVDAMVRKELRIRWERASLIRGREIPPVDDL